jgi:lipopolysaccharide biosynthesis glycosyltransferase
MKIKFLLKKYSKHIFIFFNFILLIGIILICISILGNRLSKLQLHSEFLSGFSNYLLERVDSLERRSTVLEGSISSLKQETKNYKKQICNNMVNEGINPAEISEGYHCLAQIELDNGSRSSVYKSIRYESLALETSYKKIYQDSLFSIIKGVDLSQIPYNIDEYNFLSDLSKSDDNNVVSRALYRMSLINSIGRASSLREYNYNLSEASNLKNKAKSLISFPEMKSTDIIFTIDNNATYIKYAQIAIASILLNADLDNHYNFYFVTDEEEPLSSENKEKLNYLHDLGSYKVRFINPPAELFYKEGKSFFEPQMRNQIQRFIAEDVLTDLDSALYLDVDLIALRDLYDLQHLNFEGNIFAAATEYMEMDRRASCGLNYTYVNIGVVVENLKLMRESKNAAYLTKKYYEDLGASNQTPYNDLKSNTCFALPNQDMFNRIYKDKIKFISRRWNYLPIYEYNAKLMPFIIHFAGTKPSDDSNSLEDLLYMRYKKLVEDIIK